MGQFFEDFVKQFQNLSAGRQITLALTAAGSLAFLLWTAVGTRDAEYRLLYRGLEDAEVAQITQGLTAERIEYKLEEGGSAVFVPALMVPEARIRMAGRGLPGGGSPGFEIFDRGTFGLTDFVQKINYRRALQGELSRSVEQLEAVERARVQIAVPEHTVFVRRNARQATASVVVQLQPGWDLDAGQVRGIVHLVASSVDGLEPGRVTLVDDRGRLLTPSGEGEGGDAGPAVAIERQSRLERKLEKQIESILERTVGIGRVVARVKADLDWTRSESTEERYDPDSQVARSEQRTTDSSKESSGESGGVVGVAGNSPNRRPESVSGGRSDSSTKTSETINYEISKIVSHTVMPVGRIKRLSIAVLVDGKPATADAAEAEGGDESSFVPWDEQKLQEFEKLAKNAIGFDAQRGDEISVINAPFDTVEIPEEKGWPDSELLVLLTTVLQGVAFLVGLLLFAKLMVKPLAEAVAHGQPEFVGVSAGELQQQLEVQGEGAGSAARTPLGEGDAIPGLLQENSEMSLQEQVEALAGARGDDSVKTIRGWLAD